MRGCVFASLEIVVERLLVGEIVGLVAVSEAET